MKRFGSRLNCLASVFAILAISSSTALAAPRTGRLHVGWSSTSITPDKPVALSGQFSTRIAKSVHDPVTATVLAIEVKDAADVVDQAVMVSCDVVAIRRGIQDKFRDRLAGKIPGLDLRKVFLNATHTHTGPVLENVRRSRSGVPGAKGSIKYKIPKEGVVQVDEYVDFMVEQLANAVVAAWNNRKPAGVSWSLSHAVVGHNRRAVFVDGKAVMYARTNSPRFRNIEGSTDHGIELLFFWDEGSELTGVAVNIACPSQVVESKRYLSADFWHDVRQKLQARYSKDLFVLGLCGAAGDQSPHLLIRKRAEATLRKRKGISETEEIGIRIADAVTRVFDAAKANIRTMVPFAHEVEQLRLPARRVSKAEADRAKARVEEFMSGSGKLPESIRTKLNRERDVVVKFEHQCEAFYPMELHVLRLGDIAIATNPFELFVDFGLRMKARSKAEQTFVVQLACDSGGYLPTDKAVKAGGYGAEPPDSEVGPKGGRLLVERTLKLIEKMWTPAK